MDTETRAAITALSETMSAGFGRMDRYFELQQAQFVEWRAELRGEMHAMRAELRGEMHEMRAELRAEIADLRERVDSLTERVTRLEHQVAQLRDHITREVADIKLELRELRGRSGQTDELRREVAELAVRVDRLERRQD